MGPILALFILVIIPLQCAAQPGCHLTETEVRVDENNEVPYRLTSFRTDEGYTLVVPDNLAGLADIVGTEIYLIKSLDYEERPVEQILLTCQNVDGISVSLPLLIVIVNNLNDNAPEFPESSYRFVVLEDHRVGEPIGARIVATDRDTGPLYYELNDITPETAGYFRLTSPANAQILVNRALDYDRFQRTELLLIVRDTELPGASVSHTATTTIHIEIVDVDNVPPRFIPCVDIGNKLCINSGYRSSVNRLELVNGPLIFSPGPIQCVDGDVSFKPVILYSIVSGNNDGTYSIDNYTGNITMFEPPSELGTTILQVMCNQENDTFQFAMTTVQIEVKEKNSHPPQFEKNSYLGQITSGSAIGSFVTDTSAPTNPLQVFAADEDFSDKVNPSISYRIVDSTDFTISRDGLIRANTVFTSPVTITFTVTATDTATNEVVTTTVTVEVTPAVTTPATTTTSSTTTGTGTTSSTTTGTGTTSSTTPGTGTTTSTTPGTGTTSTTTPGTGSTTTTTPGTGTTTSTTPSTGTTSTTTPGTGTTTTTTPGTGTTTTTTPGTGTTTTTTLGTGTTTTTTPGTGTTTTTTPGTGTTTSTTPGTGTTTTTTPGTGTTTSTTPGTGTTTTTTPGTGTTTSTTPGTGTTTTTTPVTGTTTTTTPGTGTTTTTTPGTGTTSSTTPGTGTTTTTAPGTGTTTTTTPGAGTTTSTTPGTGTTTTTTPGTGTTTSTTTGTGTTTSTTPGTGTTTSTTTGTGTTTSTTPGTGTTTSTTTGTGTTTSTTTGTGTTTSTTTGTGTTTTIAPGETGHSTTVSHATEGTITVTDDGSGTFVKTYSVSEMAAIGASLGVLLALCLVGLGFLIYKLYGDKIRTRLSKDPGNDFSDDGNNQLIDDSIDVHNGDNSGPASRIETSTNLDYDAAPIDMIYTTESEILEDPLFESDLYAKVGVSRNAAAATAAAAAAAATAASPVATQETENIGDDGGNPDDPKQVKSILNKTHKENDIGYKAVWFLEGAEAEVVVIEGAEEGEADDEETENEEEYDNNNHEEEDDEDDEPVVNYQIRPAISDSLTTL